MEYGSTPAREKQPELTEAHIQFQELGQRLEKCLIRLRDIGNKLCDESGNISENKNQISEPSPRLPGLVSDIHRDADGFKMLISGIESQLQKLEKQI